MCLLDHKEGWVLKNWCFWTVVLEKILESPLDCKEIKPAHPKGNQSWRFTGRTHAEAEAPIFWPPDVKSWLTWKDLEAGKDWGQQKGITEDELVGWHYWLNGHLREIVKDRKFGIAVLHEVVKRQTGLSNWIQLYIYIYIYIYIYTHTHTYIHIYVCSFNFTFLKENINFYCFLTYYIKFILVPINSVSMYMCVCMCTHAHKYIHISKS